MAENPDTYLAHAVASSVSGFSIPVLNLGALEIPDDKFGCSFILCGSTRSGKSTIMNYLYKKFFSGDYISTLMSNSLQSDAYNYVKKHCNTSDHYHPEILKDCYRINHETKNKYKFLFIIDDVTHTRHDKEIQRLMCLYRNSRMSCIVSGQGLVMMDKLSRGNINYVMLGKMNSASEIERNIKEFLTAFFPTDMKMAAKIQLYKELTADYCWLLIDNINGKIMRTKLRPEQLIGS